MGQESGKGSRAKHLYRLFLQDETAQDLIEYVLLAALIGMGGALAWSHILGSVISLSFYIIGQQIQALV